MLRRLEVGLIDEGVQLTRVLPAGVVGADAAGLERELTYQPRRFRFGRLSPAYALARGLRGDGTAEDAADVVHAFSDGAWRLAVELASMVSASVALEAWRTGSAGAAARLDRSARRGGFAGRLAWSCPGEAFRKALTQAGVRSPIRVVPWGVHQPASPRTRTGRVRPSICVVASGADRDVLRAVIEGIDLIAEARPETLVFLDSSIAEHHPDLYKMARSTRLEDPPPLVGQMEQQRHLVLRSDVIVVPEMLGEARSITLEAMASGCVVVASPDDAVEELIAGETALVVSPGTPSAWQDARIRALEPGAAGALSSSARSWAAEHRPAHRQVAGVLETYRMLTQPETIAFPSKG